MTDRMALTYLFLIILSFSIVSSAHYIVGKVEDALDSTSPNGRTVVLWNPANGISDNLTDIVGTSGNSGTNNTYMIDCELLSTPCQVNDILNITLLDDGTGYFAKSPVQVTVTGAGFDIAPNITMNSPPSLENLSVDDSFNSPANEIDLSPATTTEVRCTGVIVDYDGISTLSSVSAEFYSVNSSFFGDSDDKNFHYTNNSCEINTSYGNSNQGSLNCTFQVQYFANAETWACTVNLTDSAGASSNFSDQTKINSLLALGVNDSIDFGEVAAQNVSNETVIEVVNYGNVDVNLSLSGYGSTEGDGYSLVCAVGAIPVNETKYNLTSSNPGQMTYSQLNQFYTNLSSNPVTEKFKIPQRQDDTTNNAKNNTYWRAYTPKDVAGSCTGNIVFGAVQS